MTRRFYSFIAAASLCAVFAGNPAFAADDDVIRVAGSALTDVEMAASRGGDGNNGESMGATLTSTQTITAENSGSTLDVTGDLTNGAITLGDNFGGSGLGSYVLNTGNNSTLTAALNVTVEMTTPAATQTP